MRGSRTLRTPVTGIGVGTSALSDPSAPRIELGSSTAAVFNRLQSPNPHALVPKQHGSYQPHTTFTSRAILASDALVALRALRHATCHRARATLHWHTKSKTALSNIHCALRMLKLTAENLGLPRAGPEAAPGGHRGDGDGIFSSFSRPE